MNTSIIIPTIYWEDKATYFGNCMEAIYKQEPYQIIVKKDLYKCLSKIRNKLIELADWDIIWLIDDHVELYDWVLERVEEIFSNYDIDFLQWVFHWWQETDKRYFWNWGIMFWRKGTPVVFDESIWTSWGHEDLLMARDLLEKGVKCWIAESVKWWHYWKPTSPRTEEKDLYAKNKYPERWELLKKENISYYDWEVLVID